MKKKLIVNKTSSDAYYALSKNNTLRLYSLMDTYVNGKIGLTTKVLTDVTVRIPEGYIGILSTSYDLLHEGVQIVGGIEIYDACKNNEVWEIAPNFINLNSNISTLVQKHTHIATLHLIKHKKIKL